MTHEFVKVEREGPVTIVTLNRPEVMNALQSPAHFELGEVFDAFAADPEQWVAIVTGAGERAFSAGSATRARPSRSGGTRVMTCGQRKQASRPSSAYQRHVGRIWHDGSSLTTGSSWATMRWASEQRPPPYWAQRPFSQRAEKRNTRVGSSPSKWLIISSVTSALRLR